MLRTAHPLRDQIDKLRQPMTRGERMVFDLFDRELDEKWEIHSQPHLNGCRTDFVLQNPNIEIAVIEVQQEVGDRSLSELGNGRCAASRPVFGNQGCLSYNPYWPKRTNGRKGAA